MLMAHGFLKPRVRGVRAACEPPVDVVATSEVSVSVTVDDPARLVAAIVGVELREVCADVSGGAADARDPVCVVGENLRGPSRARRRASVGALDRGPIAAMIVAGGRRERSF